jgi:hypothetical protein
MPASENAAMTWDWVKGNIPTIIAVGGLFWYTAQDNATMKALQQSEKQERMERQVEIDRAFSDIKSQIAPIGNLVYRVSVLETGLMEISRQNALNIEAFRKTGNEISRDVNTLSTKVEVLTSRIETLAGQRVQKTLFMK